MTVPLNLGTDPEFFIEDKKGVLVPAWEYFPSKDKPIKLQNKSYYGSLENVGTAFHDGAAVEINVIYNACKETLASRVFRSLQAAQARLPKSLRLVAKPMAKIEDMRAMLKTCPEDALVFGCDPAWNAYTGKFEGLQLDATTHPYRYAGGHLHISVERWYSPYTLKEYGLDFMTDRKKLAVLARLLDRYLALPFSAWFNKPETFLRRKYYGKAGEFRVQDYGGTAYGFEYRTLGPEVWNSPAVESWAFGVMRHVVRNYNKLIKTRDTALERRIRHAVNTGIGIQPLLKYAYLPPDESSHSTRKNLMQIIKDKPFQSLVIPPKSVSISHYARQGWQSFNGNCRQSEEAYYKLMLREV